MCQIPCSLCANFTECEIRLNQPFNFVVYKKGKFSGTMICTKIQAQEFTFMNHEYTLVLKKDELGYLNISEY